MKHCVQFPDDKFLAVRPCLVAICLGNRPAAKLLGALLYRYNLRLENKEDAENHNAIKSSKGEKPDQDTTYRIFRKQSQLIDDMCGEMTEKTLHDVAVPMLQLLSYLDVEEHMQANCYIVDVGHVQQALNLYVATSKTQTKLEEFVIANMQLEKFLITSKELEEFLIDKKNFLSGLEKVLIWNRNTSYCKRGRKPTTEAATQGKKRKPKNIKESTKNKDKEECVVSPEPSQPTDDTHPLSLQGEIDGTGTYDHQQLSHSDSHHHSEHVSSPVRNQDRTEADERPPEGRRVAQQNISAVSSSGVDVSRGVSVPSPTPVVSPPTGGPETPTVSPGTAFDKASQNGQVSAGVPGENFPQSPVLSPDTPTSGTPVTLPNSGNVTQATNQPPKLGKVQETPAWLVFLDAWDAEYGPASRSKLVVEKVQDLTGRMKGTFEQAKLVVEEIKRRGKNKGNRVTLLMLYDFWDACQPVQTSSSTVNGTQLPDGASIVDDQYTRHIRKKVEERRARSRAEALAQGGS